MFRASILSSLLLTAALSLSACEPELDPGTEPVTESRGELVSTELLLTLSQAELAELIAQIGLPEIGEPTHGIAFHRVVYRTVDIDGEPTKASGMIVVPEGPGPFPVLSDQHGTQVLRRPTISDPLRETELLAAALLFASHGYLVVGADYLGLGVNEGLHPYYHADSEASATVDMLRCVRAFIDERDIAVTDELFLTGYSQGAHVTMALHRALEREPTAGWTVTASAPMAGAYDLADISFPAALTEPSGSSSLYVSYALLAYDRVYDIYAAPSEVFVPPYDAEIEGLFDGTRDFPELLEALPPTPAELLQPEFVDAYLGDDEHPLRDLFAANDVLDWTPAGPITLFHGKADVDVPFANAEHALAVLQQRGASVELVNVGDEHDHATAGMPAYFGARAWFESLRAAP